MHTLTSRLQNIYNDLIPLLEQQDYSADRAGSLFKGPWGALLYMFYYEQYIDQDADNAAALLEKIYAAYSPDEGLNYSFCNGHTGPYWLLDHLNRHEFLDMDMQHIAGDFITIAITQSRFHTEMKNFDFLHGSIGICNFMMSFADREDVREHLAWFTDQLMAVSKVTPQGRSLPIFYTYEQPAGEYVDAFSLAHGSCAALILLAKIYTAGIATDTCRQLAAESIDFILNHRLQVNDTGMNAMYPAILDGKYSSAHSRLAWCYGDLNVAWMLWYCGKTFNNAAWKNEALAVMHYNTRRLTHEAAGVMDNCICHGTSGIAAFYRKFWFETKDPAFLECATHWHNMAVSEVSFSEDNSKHGIKVWQGKDKEWEYAWDLLDGGAGVGLSLLSQLQDQPLMWDECFLLS
ncbi:lanthionine synthetase LanC family protein [Chitinophaga sp. Cy-1792]|uniref:lanthionine synthetase LanC family protein n=1 Tax=Chitinophaga sp. Cy-1792 TaxID=2608339 RepID=UPI0014219A69|nr:lanthionine synthetase LanC family protein [Chitinophaga sp. Cy-1792]